MAISVNKVFLIGTVGQDPRSFDTANGSIVASFSLATKENYKTPDGTWKDHTEWHNIVAFGRIAENAADFVHKGATVYVEGSLAANEYTAKDGTVRRTTQIRASNIRVLSNSAKKAAEPNPASAPAEYDHLSAADPDDDIPY